MDKYLAHILQAKLELDRAIHALVNDDGSFSDFETHTELAWLSLQLRRIIARKSGSTHEPR